MTEDEMQKIIEGLKNDPEVGAQVRELLAARGLLTGRSTEKEQDIRDLVLAAAQRPETKLDIDPGLVRQVKQLVALWGGGTFSEQLEAQTRSSAAGCITGLMMVGGVIGCIIGFYVLVWLIMLLASLSWPHGTTRYSESVPQAYASPSPTVRVLRALPVKP